jgi:aspartate/methionine/tyrosine aminotransferase
VKALAALYTRLLGRTNPLDPMEEMLVTDGAYEALHCAIQGHVNPGDEVSRFVAMATKLFPLGDHNRAIL